MHVTCDMDMYDYMYMCAYRLPMMLNRKLVDDLAVEFCMTLNMKIYRNRLAKALYMVERNR